jgi:molybdopterin molybdotransferase
MRSFANTLAVAGVVAALVMLAIGDDVARGQVALPAGTVIDPGAIGLAASLGQATLRVRRR